MFITKKKKLGDNISVRYMMILIFGISISQFMINMIKRFLEFTQVVVNVERAVTDVLASHAKLLNSLSMIEKENLFVD